MNLVLNIEEDANSLRERNAVHGRVVGRAVDSYHLSEEISDPHAFFVLCGEATGFLEFEF